jgi:hypothetical protein
MVTVTSNWKARARLRAYKRRNISNAAAATRTISGGTMPSSIPEHYRGLNA